MKNLTKGMLMAALITGMFGCASAYAAEDVQEFSLDPMIVTAQRTETSDLNTPASVSVITAEDIQKTGAKTVFEIIEHQVGIQNNAYGPNGREYGGSASRIVLRGLDKGTLVLVNGTPINMLNYNSTEGIPVEAVEKVEVVRGAQSVLYGAEASGGVINVITKKGGKPKNTISVGAGNFDKKWGFNSVGENYIVSISRDHFGKVTSLNDPVSLGAYETRNSTKDNAFISVSPTDKLTFNYAHTKGKFYRDYWVLDKKGVKTGVGKGTGSIGGYYYEDSRDNMSIAYNDKENKFKSVVAYNHRVVNPYQEKVVKDFIRQQRTRGNSSDNNLKTYTWDTQKAWNFRDQKDSLIVGFNLQHDYAADRENQRQKYAYKASRNSESIYVSYSRQFARDFSATLGFRGEHISDEAKDQNVFLPQIQTLYKINEKASWYTNVGKTFEMPALNQYYSSNVRKGASLKELKPQEGWTYETGLKFINDKSSVKVDVFHMDIDGKFDWDLIDPNGSTSDPANKKLINKDKFNNTGVEFEYTQKIDDKFNYRLGVMLSNPKTKATGSSQWKQEEAKFQLTAGIDYKIGKLTSNLNYLYLGKRQLSYYDSQGNKNSVKAYLGDRHVPHRSILNANFGYKADEHHSLNLNLANILGRHDVINKYESWGNPYNWMLTYNYSF